MIGRWIYCISGFRQDEGEPNGMFRLWLKLHEIASPATHVTLREWDTDWNEQAALIAETSVNGLGPRVLVCAYSWGAGHGLLRFAEALRPTGIKIEEAVLADPVYRSRLLSTRWLAFCRWPKIVIPSNVRRVRWTRQRVDYPRGHRLVAEDPGRTTILNPVEVHRGHCWMDDAPEFHRMALEVAT